MRAFINSWRLTGGITFALGICAFGIAYFQEDHAVQEAQPSRPSVSSAFGPGEWHGTQIAEDKSSEPSQIQANPEDEVLLTESGNVIANQALLNILNFYLLGSSRESGIEALKNYFAARLPATALAQAMQIAEHYQQYMQEHDTLLAAQHFTASTGETGSIDMNRLRTWVAQRALLRTRTLGADTARNWYANDDARIEEVIGQTQHAGDIAPESSIDPRYAPSREMVQRDALLQHQYAQQVLRSSMTSFAALSKPL